MRSTGVGSGSWFALLQEFCGVCGVIHDAPTIVPGCVDTIPAAFGKNLSFTIERITLHSAPIHELNELEICLCFGLQTRSKRRRMLEDFFVAFDGVTIHNREAVLPARFFNDERVAIWRNTGA